MALSTTSMAVVYAVMLDTGLNKTAFGKGILASCFINDLGTVIALGLLFAPFTYKTVVFVLAGGGVCRSLPVLDHVADSTICLSYGSNPDEMDHADSIWIGCARPVVGQRSRASCLSRGNGVGRQCGARYPLDSPATDHDSRISHSILFYSSRNVGIAAGVIGGSPRLPRPPHGQGHVQNLWALSRDRPLPTRPNERWYYTLLMSTGLTFGTISALYGLAHGIVTQEQYSFLVSAVIASAVVPTAIAGFFLPTHLLPKTGHGDKSTKRNQWPE